MTEQYTPSESVVRDYYVDPATDARRTPTGRPIADWWQDGRGRWHEGARGEFWGADS